MPTFIMKILYFFFPSMKKEPSADEIFRENLINEIKSIQEEIKINEQNFNMTDCDPDSSIIDSLIFERQALIDRYNSKLKVAKEYGVSNTEEILLFSY